MLILMCTFIVCFTTAAQLLLKTGARRSQSHALINGYVFSGYALFGLTVMLSYFLMQVMEMKYFTALMSVNYVAVASASAIILKEEMALRRWAGTLLIAIGVAIFVYS